MLDRYATRDSFVELVQEIAYGLVPTAQFTPEFRRFQETYRARPAAFVQECIRWESGRQPADYQLEPLEALIHVRPRVAVRGPHGLGKTADAVWALLWFALTRDGEDWKVPTTASVWRQLDKFLWPEVHKWIRFLRWERIGRPPFDEHRELLDLSLKLSTGEAFALASDKPELLEGVHADHLLYIFDEAKAIPDATWDAAEGAFSGSGTDTPAEALGFAFSTPGEPHGRFYDIHHRKAGYSDWHAIRITKDQAIRAGRMSKIWVEQRRRQWGEKSAIYQNRVEGEFATADIEGVIPLAWVETAVERWHRWEEARRPGKVVVVSGDIGRGGDPSIAGQLVEVPRRTQDARGKPLAIDLAFPELVASEVADTMQVAGWIASLMRSKKTGGVVDVVGLGAGVVDRLREQGFDVEAFNAGEAPAEDARDRSGELEFADRRSEGWWVVRDLLDPTSETRVALPPDEDLVGDLVAPRYKFTSRGRVKVESKDDLRKPDRLGRSTDRGDTVMQALAWWHGAGQTWLLGSTRR